MIFARAGGSPIFCSSVFVGLRATPALGTMSSPKNNVGNVKNKPYSLYSIPACLTVAVVLLLFVPACLDPIAWSPNGRYIAFSFEDYETLHLWDSKTGAIRVFDSICDVVSCRFLRHGREILFLVDEALMTVSIETGKISTVATGLETDNAMIYDISRNGKYLYYVKETDEGVNQLLRKRLWHPSQERILYTSEADIGFPAVNSDGTKLLFSSAEEDGSTLYLLHLPDGHVTPVQTNNARMFAWSQWVDPDHLVYTLWDGDADTGTFCRYDLSSGVETELCDSAAIFRPSFDAAHNRVALTRIRDADSKFHEIVVIQLDSGEVLHPVQNEVQTCFPVFSPCGNKLAYLEVNEGAPEVGEYPILKTITLETSEVATIYDPQQADGVKD